MATETTDRVDRIERRVKTISADLKRYFEKRLELFIVKAGETYSELATKYIQKVAGLFLIAVAFIFLLVALAEFIGALLESQPLGYVIVSALLIIFGWLFLKLQPKSFNQKIQSEFEEDVIQLLDKYEMETDQELSAIQIQENIKERENDGSK